MNRQTRVLAVVLLLGGWVTGAVLVAGSILFFGPRSGCSPISIPVGSKYVCNLSPWVETLELLLILGFWVTYLIVVPLLTFSKMITWASSVKVRNTHA